MKNTLCSLNKPGACIPKEELSEVEEKNNSTMEKLSRRFKCGSAIDRDLCVMESLGERSLITKFYKPITASLDKNHWLNNTEIDNVQYQFMLNYPGYYYSNIHMIDFGMFNPANQYLIDYKSVPVRDIDFVKEIQGNGSMNSNGKMKKYGMVVNTDVSTGNGIHWFAVFMDFQSTPMTIEYFNSSGFDIKKKDFKVFLMDLADTISLKAGKCNFVKVSDIQHQREDTSNCGVYALYYIWKRLGGTPYSAFSQKKVSDEHVVTFREYFFRL